MFRTIRIRKGLVYGILAVVCAGLLGWGFMYGNGKVWNTSASPAGTRIIDMVAGEFESEINGKEIEAYRWDPGTINAYEGETVTLRIRGINGASHPFVIEDLNVKGEVVKGKTTSVTFTASKKGIYPIVCLIHSDEAHNGPMVGYLVVN